MRAAPQIRRVTVTTASPCVRAAASSGCKASDESWSSAIAFVTCGTLVVERTDRMPDLVKSATSSGGNKA